VTDPRCQGVGPEFKPQYHTHTKNTHKIYAQSWAEVLHAYNPSYLGGRDQKDHGVKPAQEKM
jgi:hypothetical protein